jgi:hypothetical protein
MSEIRKIILGNSSKEAHMVGDCVAVCWNVKKTYKEIKGEDGHSYKAEVWQRTGAKPYIDFIAVSERSNRDDGNYYECDYSPVDGGLSTKQAEKIRDELTRAIEYLKSL